MCIEDPLIVVTVNGSHKVLYKEEFTTLSAIMEKLKNVSSIAGSSYFSYEGEPLVEIAYKTQWKAW